jgi:hypothetical protein
MRILLVLGVLAAACGDDGGPAPADAARANDAAADSPQNACPTATSCPCFTNYDCPDSYACVSQDDTGTNIYCVPGQRGTGAVGAPCTGEADCASALCVDGSSGMSCSDLCDSEMDCVTSLPMCIAIVGEGISICAPP